MGNCLKIKASFTRKFSESIEESHLKEAEHINESNTTASTIVRSKRVGSKKEKLNKKMKIVREQNKKNSNG